MDLYFNFHIHLHGVQRDSFTLLISFASKQLFFEQRDGAVFKTYQLFGHLNVLWIY
jgi:hypothetical protein